MNDLNGLDWSSKQQLTKPRPNDYSAFSTLRPTPPGSGRVSPLPPNASSNPPSKPATPANDSFSNLVSFSSSSANKSLSLQDQQKRLADLKLQQGSSGRNALNQYAPVDDSVWNNLGSGRSTPAPVTNGPAKSQLAKEEDEDDMFAVFNAPKSIPSRQPVTQPIRPTQTVSSQLDDDDDPFGLSEFQAKASRVQTQRSQPNVQQEMSLDDDDVLGLLGRPVSEFPPPRAKSPEPAPVTAVHPQEKAVAEIVDMGFPADKARRALETTESGLDVQAAVGWLLNQAHAEAQDRSRNVSSSRNDNDARQSRSRPPRDEPEMRPRREKASTPSNDPAQIAGDLGATFLKTAGSLWKQSQKKIQQAVQEFNSDGETNQPKWMRDASPAARPSSRPQKREGEVADQPRRRQNPVATKQEEHVTDEALMLEMQRPEKPAKPSQRSRQEPMFDSRDHSPAVPSRLREASSPHPPQPQAPTPRPRPQQQAPPSRTTLNRQAAEEQASQAYVSSARRRKPAAPPPVEEELLGETSKPSISSQSISRPVSKPQVQTPSRPLKTTPVQVRPPAPVRNIPSVSSIAMKASHIDRNAGNDHFKRGDYSAAHQSYSKSISYLPATHPIMIILLTNRALTAIKIGEPKTAVTDSDTAIALIGPAKGESETVDLTNGDAPKPMRDYYGKALMRKAEALEHMERWSEAASVWREAVESGHGGAAAIQGRQRAENAAKPKPAVAAKKPTAKPAGKSAAAIRAGAQAEKAAVDKLRAQNAAAEKLDDERFHLSDAVDTKINNWRGGKQDNLRALLSSLDLVLWPEAQWKKISMADLILPNKVKIQYMKGIAKVHPDKIPTTATTEQRMIAGAVFSTLNEAWDKFKKENNL